MAVPLAAEAQSGGRIVGTVTAATGESLNSVQVYVVGTSIGVLTNATGTFALENVPAGPHTVVASRLGFAEVQRTGINVTAGGSTTLNIQMSQAALALQGVVATGLVDPVEGVRAPIAVSRMGREQMPVAQAGGAAAVQNLQGRVAGVTMNRGSGQPGSGITMMLRTPTSVRTDGSGSPLIVVDGVILGGEGTISTSDIDAMDIESIEVIRGAAASSLYGSRAAAGVISITTARGSTLPVGETRFTFRSEAGISANARAVDLNNHHAYRINDQGQFVNAAGQVTVRDSVVFEDNNRSLLFMDNAFPGKLYDNVAAVARPGNYFSNNFSLSGNSPSTNFAVTASNTMEQGALIENDGYHRTSVRLNVDHRFAEAFSTSVSMSHSRDGRENIPGGSPVDQALRVPRDFDMTVKKANGDYEEDTLYGTSFRLNPLRENQYRENDQDGTRTLVNMGARWNGSNWLEASTSVGYDRNESWSRSYTPKGFFSSLVGSDPAHTVPNLARDSDDGSLSINDSQRGTLNVEGQLTGRHDIGALNIRTTVRGLLERSNFRGGNRSGSNFRIYNVPQFSAIGPSDQRATGPGETEIRALGYLWDTAFDYDGKYIFTFLGRRDGSSLFGPDSRWHNYYRVAGAWRIAEEEWFNIPNVNELKLSFARGTAGGRPSFLAQYDTWSLNNDGVLTPGTFGNPLLAPEHTTENEISLNAILFDRYSLTVTHARQKTTDQLIAAPYPAFSGYSTGWVNDGAISGHSTEVEFEAQVIQKADFSWTMNVVGDYKFARITEWNTACTTPAWASNCLGAEVYGLYSKWLIVDDAGLLKHRGGEAYAYRDQFEVNDEGFLVWVGDKHYYEGLDANGNVVPGTWGTKSPDPAIVPDQAIGGRQYEWGMPIPEENAAGSGVRQLLGHASPTNIGWSNNLRYKIFNFSGQFQGAVGGVINNRRNQQLSTNEDQLTGPRLDQFGRPNGLKKPIAYYNADVLAGDATYYVEDASYIKLRSLSAGVTLNRGQLQNLGLGMLGVRNLSFGLVARNLLTLTTYDGFDPEAGLNLESRGNAENSAYPPTRALTAEFSLTF
ncbi:MAG: SusC/RagA family TonB-linked outer membrane protein [Gemmatimonadota bacterium]|nr:SusC/RagA family TonB-linked outer membrane protein [Gemmatimonadota bacterium]